MVFSSRNLKYATLALRVVLGVIFVYAAWLKLKEPWELFALAISGYQLLPLNAVQYVARTLPWFELVVGLLLISGVLLRVSASAVSLLLLGFMALMIRSYVKGMSIDCGCFGSGDPISWKTLLRDGSMLAASLVLTCMAFIRQRKPA
jgi:uncharacterized membrane protein YphA (DoxX/SURF4 family)